MSSNQLPPALNSSKPSNSSGANATGSSQIGTPASVDNFGQRRSGGSGSFGAGAASRSTVSSPRNNQSFKKQNKASKRFRLTDEEALVESGTMRLGSRKGQTNITHLMNFSLPPRPQSHNHSHFGSARGYRRNPTWGLGSGYHAVDKARYVHANYRFIVDPRGNYQAQSVEPDVFLDWNNVLQILVSAQSQDAACPICLGTPVSPRMAKCGHIFCLPCLIRYMHSEDDGHYHPEKRNRYKKCPICFDSIYMSDIRAVRWYTGQEGPPPREGFDVVLRLVRRDTGSTLALPRDGAEALAKVDEIPWHFAAEVMDYARVMRGTEEYMVAQYDQDIEDLQRQEKEDELLFGEDAEWTKRAVKSIREQKEKVKGIGNPPSMPTKPTPAEPKLKREPIKFETDEAVPDMYLIHSAARSGQTSTEGASTPQVAQDGVSLYSPQAVPLSPSEPSASVLTESLAQFRNRQQHADHPPAEYFFYQALLHYYLSPLDIRILKAAFGSFSSFPSTILPRVERVSTGHIVDDELRKRTKYLAHLPFGCEVGFLECDWTDTVAPEVLERFKPEIEKRRKRNSEKEAREEKERQRAEKEEEDKRYAMARRRQPAIPADDRFSADDFQPLVSAQVADTAASLDGDVSSSSPPWQSRRTHSSAFASLASPSTSPSAPRTVWGTTAVTSTSPVVQPVPKEHENVDDGWLQGWERDLLNEEDLVAQVQAASIIGESSKGGSATPGGKKKKGKKITLMSTTARRGA